MLDIYYTTFIMRDSFIVKCSKRLAAKKRLNEYSEKAENALQQKMTYTLP
jgi:hypothetical protein